MWLYRLTPNIGGPVKRHVSSFLELAFCIYKDACAKCPADVSDLRDLITLRSRVENEGVSFLTITLPNFCKGVETALKGGLIDPSWKATIFRGFPFRGAIPAFLSGMLGRIFDSETGRIKDENDPLLSRDFPTYIGCIRQICLAFKKVGLPCTERRNNESIANFIGLEQFLSTNSASPQDREYFTRVSGMLWDNLVVHLSDTELLLKHGPGATAEGISGNRKYSWQSWYERLDNYFPLFEHGYVTSAMDSKEVERVQLVPQDQEEPVKVTLVPKTLKGPRIIAIEPVCMQYAQQGIRDILYKALESYTLTRGHVNFRDQSINQRLAMKSSRTGRLATIDLSDASDRVPRDLALEMFRANPEFQGAIDACRSTSARLPDGRIISPLSKFASMGSALCFPVESMYFYTICVGALLRKYDLPMTFRSLKFCCRRVYVYGDDILVPAHAADVVLEDLHKYFCKPNTAKTFTTGRFRESCGVDAYLGRQVTPVYIRSVRPEDKRQAADLVSWSATGNQFYFAGYPRTAELMHTVCEQLLGIYPEVPVDSTALGRHYRLAPQKPAKYRWNKRFQRREVRALVASSVYRTDMLSGYAALQKSLLRLEAMPRPGGVVLGRSNAAEAQAIASPVDERHLERSALHGAVTLKLRWVPVQ